MPIEFFCPHCYSQVITPDETAGKQGRCPNCSEIVKIPERGAVSQPPPGAVNYPVAHQGTPRHVPPGQGRRPVDPFKPTPKNTEVSETIERQFGYDKFEEKKEEGSWGEDTDMSYKMRKMVSQERAKNRLVGPAQTLITLAIVNLIIVALSIVALVIYVAVMAQREVEIDAGWITLWIVLISVVMMDSTMIFIGGNHMRLTRSYSMAYTGAVFALLPLNILFFVTIPFGVWAISTLNDPTLAEGFKRR